MGAVERLPVKEAAKKDATAAERNRRARQRRKEGRRVLRVALAVDEESVAILIQRSLLPASAQDSDKELVDAISDLIDQLAESGREE